MSLVLIDWWDSLAVHGPKVETAPAKKIIDGDMVGSSHTFLQRSSRLMKRNWA